MIYTPENTSLAGKPVNVYVDGVLLEWACYADTVNGVAEYAPSPVRATEEGDEIYTEKLYGKVTVEPVK